MKQEIEALHHRLAEAEETLRAIHQGEVDALVVTDDQGVQVFTLRNAEEPYHILIGEMNQGAAMLSSDGIILYANRRLSEILETPSKKLVGAYFQSFIIPSDQLTWEKLVELGKKSRSAGEVVVRNANNREIPLYLALNSMPPTTGADLGLVATDLTERKQVEQEIRQRNRELALLNRIIAASTGAQDHNNLLNTACRELAQTFQSPHAAAVLANPKKTEVAVVAEFCRQGRPSVLGLSVPFPAPSVWKQLTADKIVIVENASTNPQLAMYQEWIQRLQIVSLLILPLRIEAEPAGALLLADTKPRQFSPQEIKLAQQVAEQVNSALTLLHVVQTRAQLEEQLRQAQKMDAIGRLAGGVAHDFNNLLTVINGHSDWVLSQLPPDHPLRQDIEPIRKAGERAARLTRQLLALSRRQILQPEILDLNEVVVDIQKMLQRLIGENIRLHAYLATGLGKIKADRGQLEQVIINLAVNARDAMPDGGKLILETANVFLDEAYARQHVGVESGTYVLLAISDTGIGMDKETLSYIFEPFFTTKERGKGTGLGLSIVHGIVQQSGGHIQVYSEPGRGTTFKIYLPCAAQPTPAETTAQALPQTQTLAGNETVLIVEDDLAVRQLARHVLSSNGYTVLDAASGQEAQQIFTTSVQLLLTDVVLPDMSGRQLAEMLRQQSPDLKVLYTSGYTNNAIVHHGVLEVSLAFLQKPFSPTTLLQKVRETLDAT